MNGSRKFASMRTLFAVVATMCVASLGVGLVSVVSGGRGNDQHHMARVDAAPRVNKLAEAIGFPMDIDGKARLAIEERASSVETQDDWGSQLRESKYFERLKTNKAASWRSDPDVRRSGLINADPGTATVLRPLKPLSSGPTRKSGDDDSGAGWGNGTYRTVCVRSCDGYYWPVSFATTKSTFESDQATCQQSCGGPKQARLFVYKNPGEQPEDMEDLDGKPYKRTPTAFQFRASYDESCKCRPHPWEDASRDLHQSYKLQALADKGDKRAREDLKELKKKIQSSADAGATADKPSGRAAAPETQVPDPGKAKADEKRRQSRVQPPISVKAVAHNVRPRQMPVAQFVPRIVVMRYDPAATAVLPRPERAPKSRKDAELAAPAADRVVRR